MADALVFELSTKLVKHAWDEVKSLEAVRGEVNELKEELQWMRTFLKAADLKRRKNEGIREWVKEIRELCFKAEDVIDEFVYHGLMRSRHGQRRISCSNLFKSFALFVDEMKARHKTSREINAITAKLRKISERRSNYGINDSAEVTGESKPRPWQCPPVSSFDDAVRVVGLEHHIKSVVERLIADESRRRSVMSIVGIGGVGKTTLAWKVFNSPEIVKKFEARAWVRVSNEYKGVTLLKKLLEKLEGSAYVAVEGEEVLNARIRERLGDRRYLVVLDDVWREEVWNHMKESLPDRKNGSWVVMTTRFWNVAESADRGVEPYELEPLNREDCLELLLQRAFPYEENPVQNCPKDLRPIAEHLVENCGRLPLALEVLGSRLCNTDMDPHSWWKVLQRLHWQDGSSTKEGKCLSVVASSYWDLPEHLKSCFLYLAGFPEYSEIYGWDLIRLWVAEGFVEEERKGLSTMEEKAEEYLEELIQRSMVQATERDYINGRVIACRVHDLLHEFAVSEAEDVGFLKNTSATSNSAATNTRRVALLSESSTLPRGNINLRTLLNVKSILPSSILNYKLLRVLDIYDPYLARLPEEIGTMINLRYLRLQSQVMTELPLSMGDLQFLETLDLKECWDGLRLPEAVWKIPTLRHIRLRDEAYPGLLPPESVAKLGSLQTLECKLFVEDLPAERRFPSLQKVNVALNPADGNEVRRAAVFLAGLPQLVSLKHYAYGVESCVDLQTKEFAFHSQLRSLDVTGSWRTPLEEYEFPPCLAMLVLLDSRLVKDPMKELEKLPKLRHLELLDKSYVGKEMVCSDGGFPQLRFLMLSSLNGLERWRVEAGSMAKLQRLEISACRSLRMHPDFQHLKNLKVLKLIATKLDVKQDKIKHISSVEIR